jgi:hypothetical protein
MLMPDATSTDAIAQAAADVLREGRFQEGTQRMAVAIGRCGGAREAAEDLEILAASVFATPGGQPLVIS